MQLEEKLEIYVMWSKHSFSVYHACYVAWLHAKMSIHKWCHLPFNECILMYMHKSLMPMIRMSYNLQDKAYP